VTDNEFWVFINSTQANTVLLVVAQYYNLQTDSAGTLYVGTSRYMTKPTDNPPNILFDGVVNDMDTGRLVTSLSVPIPTDNRMHVGVSDNIDDLTLINSGGRYDYLLDCVFDGYQIDVYLGDISLDFSEFRQIKRLIGANITASEEFTLRLQFSSLSGSLNCEAQRQYITDGISKGNPVPLAYGKIYRASPVLLGINPTTTFKRYKLNQYRIKSITNVCDNGIAIPSTNIVQYLSTGEFELKIEPSGLLTVDFEGTVDSGGVYLDTAGLIIQHLLQTRSPDIVLDSASLAAFVAANTGVIGVYVTQRINLNELIDNILDSVLGFKYFGYSNTMYLGSLTFNISTTPVEINDTYIISGGLSMDDTFILPLAYTKITFARNYTPSDTSALALPETTRQAIKLPYQVENAGVIYSNVTVSAISKPSSGVMRLTFSPASLATMNILADVKVGDFVAVYLGVATVNQGYFKVVNVNASSIDVTNPSGIAEPALTATASVLMNSPLYNAFKNPISSEERETFFANRSDAIEQCSRLLKMYGKLRRIYTLKLASMNIRFYLLQHIRLVYNRYGMSNGVDAWIVSAPDVAFTSDIITIKVLV